MLRHTVLMTCTAMACSTAGAQNLVPNPSFEEITSCPTFASMLDTAAPWFNPTQGTPELFHACAGSGAYAGVPMNYSGGYQMPRTGNGFAGIYVLRPDNSNMREYIEVPLTEPLEAGACYSFSMFVNAANDNELVCDGIGAYFNVGELEVNTWQVLPLMPHIDHPTGVLINDTLGWTEVSGSYTAMGGEDHLIIGNFRDDAATAWAMFNPGVWYANTAYLLVDDVSLVRTDGVLDLGPDTLVCEAIGIELDATVPGATSTLWNDGSTEPLHTVTTAGIHSVTVHVGACSFSDEVQVDVLPDPFLDIGPDRSLCAGLSDVLTATIADASELVWDNSSTYPQRTVDRPGIYYATTSNACGIFTDSVRVIHEDCPDGIYLPNAFSPNDDGINDGFAPVFDERLWAVEYTVYDRWGQKLFNSPNGMAWLGDGTPLGIYVVQLTAHAKTSASQERALRGHVALVR